MTKEIRNPKAEWRRSGSEPVRHSGFVIDSPFGISEAGVNGKSTRGFWIDRSRSANLDRSRLERLSMSTAALPISLKPSAETAPEVTTELHVETPENVVLNYQLAGPAVRCAAYAIDLLVRAAMMVALGIVMGILGGVFSFLFFGFLFVVFHVVDWFYYVISECFFRGKSIGKHALGLRVVQDQGYPITFWSSCVRNLLRFPDSFPFLLGELGVHALAMHGVGFLTILLTKNGQRLGDLVAGTVVITERTVQLPREPIILEKIQPLPRNDFLSNYVPSAKTLAIVEQFLGRRFVLTHERGHALASVLASRLAEKLGFQGDPKLVQQYPMAFLARVYVTFLKRADDEETDDRMPSHDSLSLSSFDSLVSQNPRRRR
jgi:uncharacterized RDD family membrane protein YckC